jgi:hypothetical protein
MTVKELIELLQNCPENSIVLADNKSISLVWDCPTSNRVEITVEEEEAPTDEEMNAMYDDYVANYGEVLDAQKINGVQ